MQVLEALFAIVQQRKLNAGEGSYTGYLFEKGLDKILKKCGEECSEVIIAAKNGDNALLTDEICDLLYHLLVLMVEQNISMQDVESVLQKRQQTVGNLKKLHTVDKNS